MFFLIIQVRDFKFMCPNDTVFDQENFICANWFEIDCRSSTFFYDKNLALFQPDERNKGATGGTMTSTTEEPSEQQKRQQEQQLKQLMVLEEQQAAQVLRQQQVLEQHEKRQQEHQVTFCAKLSISSLTTFSTCPNETNSVAQCVALRSLCSLHRIIFILFKLFTKLVTPDINFTFGEINQSVVVFFFPFAEKSAENYSRPAKTVGETTRTKDFVSDQQQQPVVQQHDNDDALPRRKGRGIDYWIRLLLLRLRRQFGAWKFLRQWWLRS